MLCAPLLSTFFGGLEYRNARLLTELRSAIERTEEERARSESIIAGIGDGISIQDVQFKVLYQNQIHKDLIGDHPGEYCYRSYEKRETICEGCPVALTFLDGNIHNAERSLVTPEGRRYFEIMASPLRNARGEIIAGIEAVREITERKRAEEEKKKLEDQLRQAQKMEAVGQLAGGIAHDFNNILSAITGYGELLEMKVTGNEQLRTYVEQILISSEKAAGLTHSLLAFSRKQVMNLRQVNLDELISRVARLLARLIGEDIEVKTLLKDADMVVMADSGQIEQVLMNLATNARDAMPSGGCLTISSELVEFDREYIKAHGYSVPGTYALVSVSDTGTGMDERTMERIFEPFFTTKEMGRGTGLGLAIVYGIIKQHNGYINVYSEEGKGTVFKIYLPAARSEVRPEDYTESAVALPGGNESILLAEDDPALRKLARTVLEEVGYKVIEAEDGEDALRKFIENKELVRLLILDMVMPKRNGREVYGEITKMKPDIRALFMSGYTADIIQKKGMLTEGVDLMVKPMSPKELLVRVREVLDR